MILYKDIGKTINFSSEISSPYFPIPPINHMPLIPPISLIPYTLYLNLPLLPLFLPFPDFCKFLVHGSCSNSSGTHGFDYGC